MGELRPTMLVVPALMAEGTTPGLVQTRSDLNRAGVQTSYLSSKSPLNADSIIYASEYDLTIVAQKRRDANAFVDEQQPLLEQVDGLIIVNDAPEEVWSAPNNDGASEVICRVPHSVGHIAAKLLDLAVEIYGGRSGRVFLSHDYPGGEDLFSVNSKARSVAAARLRLIDVYRSGPIPLHGDPGKAIDMARAGKDNY